MKKYILMLLCMPTFLNAQTTYVPDDNFEQALIDLGLDDVLDDYVLTENIVTVTSLNLTGRGIEDVTGIADFHALTHLVLFLNNLSELDVSSNTELIFLNGEDNSIENLNVTGCVNLEYLWMPENHLTELDISTNSALHELILNSNFLEDLDLSMNPEIEILNCSQNNLLNLDLTAQTNLKIVACNSNQLSELDLSNNLRLKELACSANELIILELGELDSLTFLTANSNELTFVNLKNGNNLNMPFCVLYDNPDLLCVQVDDVLYAESNWRPATDDQTTFNELCGLAMVEVNGGNNVPIYPNPTHSAINFNLTSAGSYAIVSVSGEKMLTGSVQVGKNTIDLARLTPGTYFIQLEISGNQHIEKLIVN